MRCGCFRHWKHTARLRMRIHGQLLFEMSLMADAAEKELVRDVSEKLCYMRVVTTQSSSRLRKPSILRLASSQTVHHHRRR